MDVSIEVTGLITIVMSVLSSLATKHETRKREANVFFEKLFEQFNKHEILMESIFTQPLSCRLHIQK